MKCLFDGIVEDRLDSDKILIQVYSNYLLNGGNPETFEKLTDDDIQMMHTTLVAQDVKRQKNLVRIIGGSFGPGRN